MNTGRYLLWFALVVGSAWPGPAFAQLTADRYSEGQPKSVAGCPAEPLAFHKCALDKAKTFAPPRTPSGKPDMQGYWFGLLVSEYTVEAIAADDPRAQSGVEPWEIWPGMIIEGEMQADIALEPHKREARFPFAEMKGEANVLIFPNLHAAHIATRMMGAVAEATVVGPILMGMRSPVNSLQPTASVEDIVNLASITVLQAQKEY